VTTGAASGGSEGIDQGGGSIPTWVAGYEVYENGKALASTTNTSFIATGLNPSTAYTFSVTADDTLGASAQSTAVAVTTEAAGAGNASNPVFAPYIDMSMAQDQDLTAVMAASGVKDFTLAFVLSSGPGQIGWGGVGTIADEGLPDGSSMLAQIQASGQAWASPTDSGIAQTNYEFSSIFKQS
jgi:hypothetical protein